ncbi:protease PrsW [Streptomyces inusitatus]|uniref:Protease PrsW n=1 Tax=Streptomyces inusitatus TaxID=68221 RepID=A0A918QN22_9ACTN|nr:PrsW family intramembrane metalloprotease [Streptomyces inusitatus]GGZ56816.1 protease PrsW [Streptomyces inusitatus]
MTPATPAEQTGSGPAVPACGQEPLFDAVPEQARWRYKPRRAARIWQSKAVRAGIPIIVLALCALVILALVREETGPEGFLVGLGLATLPVPLLVAAFRWLDRVEPGPWRNLIFAFAWGAFAAALVAILANSFAVRWIATATADPNSAEGLGATVIAPVVEESAKAVAILLIFIFRRRHFTGIVDGVVVAGLTATGFAFTENILYLGTAFGEDQELGHSGLESVTAATFFVRIVMSPFAHPLFTMLTGIGFGIAALAPRHRRFRRWALPLLGLVLSMGMHALWNGSASYWGPWGFYAVYGMFMVPTFALLTWLTVWTRQRELRTIAAELPAYAAAGWLSPAEPQALSSMKARASARDMARRTLGAAAAHTVSEYQRFATSLAFLRHRAGRGASDPDFVAREQELLHHMWQRKEVAAPALTYAARATGRVWVPPPHRDYEGYNPYRR